MTLWKTQAPAQLCELQVCDPPAARTHLPRSELQVLRGLPISMDAQRRQEGLMAWASVFFSSRSEDLPVSPTDLVRASSALVTSYQRSSWAAANWKYGSGCLGL